MYRCGSCSGELTIPSSAAWPERCALCGAAPLVATSGLLSPPLAMPPATRTVGGIAGGAELLAAELLEQAQGAGGAAA